jgi:hypothetical protein
MLVSGPAQSSTHPVGQWDVPLINNVGDWDVTWGCGYPLLLCYWLLHSAVLSLIYVPAHSSTNLIDQWYGPLTNGLGLFMTGPAQP